MSNKLIHSALDQSDIDELEDGECSPSGQACSDSSSMRESPTAVLGETPRGPRMQEEPSTEQSPPISDHTTGANVIDLQHDAVSPSDERGKSASSRLSTVTSLDSTTSQSGDGILQKQKYKDDVAEGSHTTVSNLSNRTKRQRLRSRSATSADLGLRASPTEMNEDVQAGGSSDDCSSVADEDLPQPLKADFAWTPRCV
ncbi:hypothetical protein BC629DRAFT_1458129 [Irpex lacteus]|nr:hypothetical protein BC629DRAFT_1458129 [Irpex lacteus]